MDQAFARQVDLRLTLGTKPDGTAWRCTEALAGVERVRLRPAVVISASDRPGRDLLALLPPADPAGVSRALAVLEAD